VLLKWKYPYQISKVVNTNLILLEVHVSYTVEVYKSHINSRFTFECFILYCHFCVDKGLYLATSRRSGIEEAVSFKWTYHGERIGLVAKQ